MPSARVVSTPASGSSKLVPKAHWSCSSASMSPAYAQSWSFMGARFHRTSHVGDVVGNVVEGGVAVDLVPARDEERILLRGAGGDDRSRSFRSSAALKVVPELLARQQHRLIARLEQRIEFLLECQIRQ